MHQELTIDNFKCFSEETQIRLGKITVCLGSNSVGKSSVIQACILLRQIYEQAMLFKSTQVREYNIQLNDVYGLQLGDAKHIKSSKSREEAAFDKLLEMIGKLLAVKVLVLSFQRESIYHISTIVGYYAGIRSYLALEKKDDFCNDLQECFPNIFFAEGIDTTVNTLNRKFEEIREDIVEHLVHIDNYQARFSELLQGHKSYQEIAQQFTAETGIVCSPQAGRDKVQALKETWINKETGQVETVVCELHTKFKTFNTDREQQDRIYFFPGKRGILEGRIIVKHIGTHL